MEDIAVAISAENDRDEPQLMKFLVLTPLHTTDSNSHLRPQEAYETHHQVAITAAPASHDLTNILEIREFSAEKLQM